MIPELQRLQANIRKNCVQWWRATNYSSKIWINTFISALKYTINSKLVHTWHWFKKSSASCDTLNYLKKNIHFQHIWNNLSDKKKPILIAAHHWTPTLFCACDIYFTFQNIKVSYSLSKFRILFFCRMLCFDVRLASS